MLIINGPNLNLLGTREKEIYGDKSFEDYLQELRSIYKECSIDYYQSNVEGELINSLQAADGNYDGILLNAAGFTHTSVAIGDAIAGISVPVIEIHISNVHAREEYRHVSLLAKHCKGVITGFGLRSYDLAIQYFLSN